MFIVQATINQHAEVFLLLFADAANLPCSAGGRKRIPPGRLLHKQETNKTGAAKNIQTLKYTNTDRKKQSTIANTN